jgi:hypothetical protein
MTDPDPAPLPPGPSSGPWRLTRDPALMDQVVTALGHGEAKAVIARRHGLDWGTVHSVSRRQAARIAEVRARVGALEVENWIIDTGARQEWRRMLFEVTAARFLACAKDPDCEDFAKLAATALLALREAAADVQGIDADTTVADVMALDAAGRGALAQAIRAKLDGLM